MNDDPAAHAIFQYVERLAADGRTFDAAEVAASLARALRETVDADHPALFAQRELWRIADEARKFIGDD